MSLALRYDVAEAIREEGLRAFPDECCGFLFGAIDGERKRATQIHPVENARESVERYHRFLITPDAYRTAERAARGSGWDVLGFYHSHPNAPALPSAYDLDHAWPWYTYLIVSVVDKRVRQMAAWVLKEDRSRFVSEPIEMGGRLVHSVRPGAQEGGRQWP